MCPIYFGFFSFFLFMCCTKEKMYPDDIKYPFAQEYRIIISYSLILINILLVMTFLNALAAVQHALRTFTMMRTERDGLAVEFSLHNIVNVRNHVATPSMHDE